MAPPRKDPNARFDASFTKTESCWIWHAVIDRHGYGRFFVRRGQPCLRAHRYAYIRAKGPIPVGMLVRHICDTPSCVNPEHLLIGTHVDNMNDMKRRGRGFGPGLGEKHPRAKLTGEQVCLIREAYRRGETVAELAERFVLNKPHVRKVVTREIWKHVP